MRGMSWIRYRVRHHRAARDPSLSQSLLDHLPGAALLADADGVVRELSPGADDHLGLVADALVGRRFTGLDEDPLRGELARGLAGCLADDRPWRGRVRCRRADGTLRHQQVEMRRLAGPDDAPRVLVVLQDVDDLVATAEALRARLALLETCVDRLPGAIFRLRQMPRGERAFDYLSDGIRELGGLAPEDLRATPERLFAQVVDEDRQRLEAEMARSVVGLADWQQTFRLRQDGGERWLEVRARTQRGEAGVTVWDGCLWDVSRQKEEEDRQRRLISTDMLTGTLNRRGFKVGAGAVIAHAARHGRALALAMLDLDHFKALNDTHGHAAGDIALKTFAMTCRDSLRPYDLIARLGGEEFAVMLSDSEPDEVWLILERLRRQVAETEIVLGGETLHITVSLGLTFLAPGDDLDEALGRADQALYRAKHGGRNRLVGPDPVA